MRSAGALLLAPVLALGAAPLPAATLVVANKAEATVSLIELEAGRVVATLPTGQGPHEVAVSPDGRLALVTDYGTREAPGSTLTLVDVAAAAIVRTIDLGDYRRPHGVAWLDGRNVLVTAEDNRALLAVDTEAGRVLRAVSTGQEISHMVAVAPDGGRAFVANIGSGTVSAIDLAQGRKMRDVATGAGAEGISFVASTGELWVTNRDADTLTVLDGVTLERRAEIVSAGFPIRAAATPGGTVLVTHARGGHLAVFSAATRAEVGRLAFDLSALEGDQRLFGDRFGSSSVPIGVVVSGDGTRAWVAHANADVVTEIDLARLEVTRTLRAGKEPDGMAWTPVDVAAAGDATP